MKLYIRAHDLGVKGEHKVIEQLNILGLDGVQLVAYKVLDDVKYEGGSITQQRAKQLGSAFARAGKTIPLIGAYFNPVHSNIDKVRNGVQVFKDYLTYAQLIGCNAVGSETGSYNDDKWTYHPLNRTEEALRVVVDTFTKLADYADKCGVNIAMEGAFGHVCYNVATLKRAVDAIDRKNVRIIFDLYNYLDISNVGDMYDILEEGLNTFGENIIAFHLKDCVVEDGKLKQVAVGKGIFDYARILTAIFRCNSNANLVFEGTTGEDIVQSVNYIRQLLRGITI